MFSGSDLWAGDAAFCGRWLFTRHLPELTRPLRYCGENLGRVENMWPLLFLAAPVVYGLVLVAEQPLSGLFWLAFAGWMLVSLRLIKRRGPGDVPRAVVSLIAGISLLDALLISGAGLFGYAALAVVGFFLTLGLQRYVSGT